MLDTFKGLALALLSSTVLLNDSKPNKDHLKSLRIYCSKTDIPPLGLKVMELEADDSLVIGLNGGASKEYWLSVSLLKMSSFKTCEVQDSSTQVRETYKKVPSLECIN